mmetsp:Transcript_76838/g.148444  ORF Transcript_76838/g.148444 Transcript_76838/m.148444 type:complete len:82 (-) Transcript_76838:66-311(-)
MTTRSVSRYCSDVEEDVIKTHVDDEATATDGKWPMRRKTGENIKPPPMPKSPERTPVPRAITPYNEIRCKDHPPCVMREMV